MNARRLLLALGAASLLAAPARATDVDAPSFTLTGLDHPARAGETLNFQVIVQSPRAMTLRNFSLRGGTATGGPPPVTGLPDSLVIPAGGTAWLAVSTLPTVAESDWFLKCQENGRTWVKHLKLSRSHYDRMHRGGLAVPLPGVVMPAPPTPPEEDPGPAQVPAFTASGKPIRDMRPAVGQDVSGLHHIVVRGTVVAGRKKSNGTYDTVPVDAASYRVFNEDWDSDELLATKTTKSDGTFEVDVYCGEDWPDLYVEFESMNAAVEVEDGTWGANYFFRTSVREEFHGSTLNLGTIQAYDLDDPYLGAAFFMMGNITKAWRWYRATTGTTPPRTDVQWPDGDWPYWSSGDQAIHIPEFLGDGSVSGHRWKTDTHVHEYGHRLNGLYWYRPDNTYDNGICNQPDGDPGHCGWCQEDGGTAIKEGIANFIADQVMDGWLAKYGYESNYTRDQEPIQACDDEDVNGDGTCPCNPNTTEGFFGVLMNDLADDTPAESDDLAAGGPWVDRFAGGAGPLLQTMRLWQIDSPNELIQTHLALVPPAQRGDFWESCANAGYRVGDATPPPAPTALVSSDHALSSPSPDATITLTWTQALDGLSGVKQHRVQRGTSASGPWGTVSLANNATYGTSELAPGSYWFRVVAEDRAGNLSTALVGGPWVVRDPLPADFAGTTLSGWTANIVARDSLGALTNYAPVTPTLEGGQANTYLNVAGRNVGELASTANNRVRLLADGAPVDSVTFGFIAAGGTFQSRNRGPFTFRGGRHTLEAWYDAAEASPESTETNNRVGRQYTWVGEKLAMGVRTRRAAPPDPTGGHNSFSVPIGFQKFKNQDGLYYSHVRTIPFTTYPWSAVAVYSADSTANLDAMLHLHSTGTEDGGYTDGLVTSNRSAGQLDAVFTNSTNAGSTVWDVGVVNTGRSAAPYFAQQAVSLGTTRAVGDTFTVTFADSQMLTIQGLDVTSGNTGKILVEVESDFTRGPVYTLWLDDTFAYGSINTYDGKVGTDSHGRSQLTLTANAIGRHALVFYRNPGSGWRGTTFTVRIRRKTEDFALPAPSGWAMAVVPRAAADGATNNVPLPAVLNGDVANTWWNFAVTNLSDVASTSASGRLLFDRVSYGYPSFLAIPAGGVGVRNNSLVAQYDAGRHTATFTMDWSDSHDELSESNNTLAHQWVWAPPVRSLGVPVWRRGTNGGPTEGWSALPATDEIGYDCDGLRSPTFTSGMGHGWAGFAVAPRETSDVDVRVHELSSSAQSGFLQPLGVSGWGPGATDFVLVNFGATNYRGFDMGVVRASDDTASYCAEIVGAVARTPAPGVLGPFTLGAGRLLDLHQFDLPVGHWTFTLVNQAGAVDWGLAAYGGDRAYPNRTDGLDIASEWLAGPGANESIVFNVAAPARYALAVYRVGGADAAQAGTYTLVLGTNPTDAPSGAPLATRLAPARPNPSAGPTRLSFTLASEGDVRLDLFDLRGARVRTLASGHLGAGEHVRAWDGRDDGGRALPAGLYFARLTTPERAFTTRIVRTER